MQIMERLSAFDMELWISHVMREQNTWADALSKGEMTAFDPEKRWDPPNVDSESFALLRKLMSIVDP